MPQLKTLPFFNTDDCKTDLYGLARIETVLDELRTAEHKSDRRIDRLMEDIEESEAQLDEARKAKQNIGRDIVTLLQILVDARDSAKRADAN
jgi:vacuolar-type H+-ATPase subunit H